jgi:hypothetical protein
MKQHVVIPLLLMLLGLSGQAVALPIISLGACRTFPCQRHAFGKIAT